ncbi:probable G-protein coupled receptor 179 [Trichosurus vulpecula]|uniref:probable G-protein coupled receptor 179 n=1 Tax=Trichosurus vulpecula TaxID=9337 RepID=UPI00186ACF05|nr:probable G-protein coupled receptor 179 [Trichosurus vulpecula]
MVPGIWGLLSWCFFCDWALGGPRDPRSLPLLASQGKLGAVPTWAPPEGAEAALAFLYSGDAQKLAGANCSGRYEAQGARVSLGLPQILQGAAGTLAQAANFLNMLLQANDIRESSVEEDIEWYQALVRSVAEGDPKAYRASLTFNPAPGATLPQLALRATRTGEETLLQDLSMARVQEARPAGVGVTMGLRKRVLSNDLGSLDSPKWPRGDGYVGDTSHVHLSPPFLECQGGQLRPGWLIELSTTFYGLKPDLSPEVRGLVRMDVDLQSVDIDQCASGPGWFSNTHQCDLNSTQCVPLESHGFILGRYLCRCRPGFYGPSLPMGEGESNAEPMGQYRAPQGSSSQLLRCHPCPEGCASCVDATPCLVEETQVLRAAVLVCQACCMLAVFLSMLISYHCRRSKTIRASGVILLETILFGSLLLYFPVFILYFKPSTFRCIVLRWVRLLGFVTVYGTITLKLYRVLQLFLSRTAQRGPHLSSGRLLRRLGLLLLLVLCFLAAWTVGTLERGAQHAPLVIRGHTSAGRHFYLCHYDRWDYIMVVAEMLLLCWGSFLCYATRAVPSAFHEPRYMGIALHNELLVSAAFHAARFILVPSLHPDWTLLLFFIHTHGTVTTTLALLFIPKFLNPGVPPREEIAAEVYEDELDLQRSGSCLNSSIASAWSECSLDPGDIRDELKKLYAQLEVHKTKKMAVNNPHLPKKRGSSRRGLGRSFMRCLAEFPEAVARRDPSSPGRGSFPRSSRRRLLSSGVQTPERPSPTLRKSHSTYDHRREQDPPLLDSLLRRKLAKKASRGGSRDSMEVPPPLGFKSASAHNLAVGERLPRAQPASLQKSLSVVAGSREKALLLASQAYLEESYRLALEREERRKAGAGSPARRPSARRLERARGDSLSPPPSPAKSSSVDSSHASGKLHEIGGRWPPPSPIRHQISTPILALGGACLGDSQTLSPTSTLAPAPAPAPALPPMPALAREPTLLTYICPWENAELPVKAESTTQEPAPGTGSGESRLPARARLFRALSVAVAVEKREATEGEGAGTEHPEGDVNETDDERHRIFPKSHSLKTPIQQGSMRSLGLAIKALTKSRSSYKEKENGAGSPERVGKSKAFEEDIGLVARTVRAGRPKPVSKQAALAPCDDEESIQNQQNTHTSRMLAGCPQEGSKERDGKPRGPEKAKWKGQVRQDPFSKNRDVETTEITPGREKELKGRYENPVKACPQLPDSTDSRTTEICPWEAPELEADKPDSLKAEASPWHMSKGTSGQDQEQRSQGEKRKTPEKSGPKGMMVTDQKKPEQQLQDREAVCPWESTDLGGPAAQPGPQHTSRPKDGHQVLGSIRRTAAEVCPWEVTEVEAHKQDSTKAEICPWEVSDGSRDKEKLPQEVDRHSLEEKQMFRKAMFWKGEKKLGEEWESTDFRGPSASPMQTPVTSEFSESVGNKVAEVCPWEMDENLSSRKAEICPWEMNKTVGKGTPGQDTGGELVQEKKRASGKESYGEAGDSTWKEAEKREREAACPWEGRDPEALPLQSDLAKVPGLTGSGTAEICPWEALEPSISKTGSAKGKIHPLEMSEGEAEKRAVEQNKGECLENKGESKESTAIASKKLDMLTETQEAVCPWEISSLKTEPQKIDQATVRSQVSGSMGSRAAEVCPWEVQTISIDTVDTPWKPTDVGGGKNDLEIEVAKDSHGDTVKGFRKSGLKERAVPAQEKTDRLIPDREATCPWENSDPGDSSSQTGSQATGQLKAGLQVLSTVGSRTADVCPWEAEAALSSAKAEICPWEVNKEASENRELGQDGESKEDRGKTLENGSSGELGGKMSKQAAKPSQEQESICPWDDSMYSAQAPVTSQSSDSKVAKVCPWEVEEDTFNKKAEICPWEVSDKTIEKGRLGKETDGEYLKRDQATLEKGISAETQHHPSREEITPIAARESICPWEDSDSGGLSNQADTQGTISSQILGSVGGRVTQVCPWEATEPQVDVPESNVAEICPWEVGEGPSEEVTDRQDQGRESQQEKRKPSKTSDTQAVIVTTHKKQGRLIRQQETVYLWESTDLGDTPSQTDPHDTTGPKAGSQVFEGTEGKMSSSKAEDPHPTGKAEICPWEMSKGAEGTDAEFQGLKGKTPRKVSSRETGEHILETEKFSQEVCPWESTDQGGGFLQPDKTKAPCQGSIGSIMAEVCPWEGMELGGSKLEGVLAEICPWEGTGTLPRKPAPQASEETEAEIPLTVQEKQSSLSVPILLGCLLPESKVSIPEVTVSSFEDDGGPQNVPEGKPEAGPISETSIQEVKGQPTSLSVPRPLDFLPESKISIPEVTVSSFEGDGGPQNVLEGKPEAGSTSEASIQEVKDQQPSSTEGQGTASPEGQTGDSTPPTVSP